ncbi:MAG: type II CRISPR-associated endonuclease Cas1 [cyanobacterium CYA1]|nr:type II CRISPR-associated endonuclease Cas1 [cyanobacterium CYA1]
MSRATSPSATASCSSSAARSRLAACPRTRRTSPERSRSKTSASSWWTSGRRPTPTPSLPSSTNTDILSRLDAQLTATKPVRKRLWSAIVAAKIRAQAANLPHAPAVRSRLLALARRVRSGDPVNTEAHAARLYWPAMFDDLRAVTPPFRRRPGEPDAKPPNNLLDYGYAALRAAMARAIVSAGLLPALGIRHHHRANPFCLADDLVEPLRPLVDARARTLAAEGRLWLDQPTKAELLLLLTATVRMGDRTGPLQVAATAYAASFARALEGGLLEIPVRADQPPAPSGGDRTEEEDGEAND